jgi:hypothetical protein
VLFIYRLIPRKPDVLGGLAIFDTLQLVAFLGLLVAFTDAYDKKVVVSGYQSVDMPFIVVPVKFDGGLPILD